MQQGGGVDELDTGGEAKMALALVAAELGRGQGQHRPQPLAAGGDDVAGELRDQRHGRLHVLHDEAVDRLQVRSEEHTSELQSLMRNSYAVFCLKKKKQKK